MPTERELCPHCGQVHEQPFSDEVLDLFRKIRVTTDEEERGSLIMQLVAEFVDDFDTTDENMADHLHDLVDDFVGTRIEHQQAALTLGRVLLRSIQQYTRAEAERMKKPSKKAPGPN